MPFLYPHLMVSLSVCLSMSVIVLQEEIFVPAVCRKCHRCDAQAWKASLEAVESCERSRVSPRLTIQHSQSRHCHSYVCNSRSRPWIVCRCASRCCECFWIEACEVGSRSSPYAAQQLSVSATNGPPINFLQLTLLEWSYLVRRIVTIVKNEAVVLERRYQVVSRIWVRLT